MRKGFLFSFGELGEVEVAFGLGISRTVSRTSVVVRTIVGVVGDVSLLLLVLLCAESPFVAGVRGRFGELAMDVCAPISWTRRSAAKISSSVKRSKGSRLVRIVPLNSVGSRTVRIDACRVYHKRTLRDHNDVLPQILQTQQPDVDIIN